MEQFDVIVIGAGASGMIAALEIASAGHNVCVLEAKEKCGGRIHSFLDNSVSVELGAEFIHGNLPITKEILEKAGSKFYEVSGSIWQVKDGQLREQEDFIEDFASLEKRLHAIKNDIPVSQFIEDFLQGKKHEQLRFTLQNYVEGYYAADVNKASTYALREELTQGDDEQFRVDGGYGQLLSYLEKKCVEAGVQFAFSQAVQQVKWNKDGAEAITGNASFNAKKILLTVSIGVWQKQGIAFSPHLPGKKEAADHLGFGHVLKIVFLFQDAFWKDKSLTSGEDLSDLNFLFSQESVPTWWTQHPKNNSQLTGWLGGPKAEKLSKLDENVIVKQAMSSLRSIFNLELAFLDRKLRGAKFYNWSNDPHFGGAYSYAVVDGTTHMKKLLEPVEQTIYFAGEGLHDGKDIGTVEGALNSGRSVARQLMADF